MCSCAEVAQLGCTAVRAQCDQVHDMPQCTKERNLAVSQQFKQDQTTGPGTSFLPSEGQVWQLCQCLRQAQQELSLCQAQMGPITKHKNYTLSHCLPLGSTAPAAVWDHCVLLSGINAIDAARYRYPDICLTPTKKGAWCPAGKPAPAASRLMNDGPLHIFMERMPAVTKRLIRCVIQGLSSHDTHEPAAYVLTHANDWRAASDTTTLSQNWR